MATTPLRIFQPAKTLVSATKWLQQIMGSSFAVILAKQFLPPYLEVGVELGRLPSGPICVLIPFQKYWCYFFETYN